MTQSTFGPAKVKYVPPKEKWGEVIEISLWYEGKPEHVWIGVKFFQASQQVVKGETVDTSNPWGTAREDIKMISSRPLKKWDTVFITCNKPYEKSEPVDKDGVRLIKGGKPVEKYTFNLNSPEEIEILSGAKQKDMPAEDNIPIAV